MRSDDAIKSQVKRIKNVKDKNPSHNFFKDPLHEGFDAQIDILEGRKDLSFFDDAHRYVKQEAELADAWLKEEYETNLH